MPRLPRWLPHPALVFVVVAWGLNFVVIKVALEELSVNALMVLRYLGMAPFLYFYARIVRQTYTPSKGDWPKFLLAGFLGSGVYMILFLEGMARVGAAQGAVCLATAPLWVSVFAVILGQESARWTLFLGGALAYAGVSGVILLGSGPAYWTPLGLALTLLSAVVWAVSVVMMKPLLGGRPSVGVFLATYPGAALALLPYGFMDVVRLDYGSISWTTWGGLIYLILVAGVAAFTAYYYGVREVGPARTSMTAYFVPIAAAISAWLLLGDRFSGGQMISVLVVLGGVALATWPTRSKVGNPVAPVADQGLDSPNRIG